MKRSSTITAATILILVFGTTLLWPPMLDLRWMLMTGFGALALGLAAVQFQLGSFEQSVVNSLDRLPVPFSLAIEQGLFGQYTRVATALGKLSRQSDPLLLQLAMARLEMIAGEIDGLARGDIVFTATETWRTAYQTLLQTLKVNTYFSVAWVRSSDYWNDPPGRQSMRLNYDLVHRGFRIERVHILPDQLWPFEDQLPSPEIRPWLQEQHERGIVVQLIRESDLANEPDLIRDFAIYGERATAVQELDDRSRTLQYVLSFDRQTMRQALHRWERLALYSVSWDKLLNQKKPATAA